MSTALVKQDAAPIAPANPIPFEPENFTQMAIMAGKLAGAGLLPKHLMNNPASMCFVMMRGREMGISPIQSMRMHVINGNVGLPADMMVAVVKARGKDLEYFKCVERTADHATWASKRKGEPEIRHTVTMKQAQQAGWTKNSKYEQEPDTMLMWRAASRLCRMEWSELFAGVYSNEELEEIRAQERATAPRAHERGPTASQPDPNFAPEVIEGSAEPVGDVAPPADAVPPHDPVTGVIRDEPPPSSPPASAAPPSGDVPVFTRLVDRLRGAKSIPELLTVKTADMETASALPDDQKKAWFSVLTEVNKALNNKKAA